MKRFNKGMVSILLILTFLVSLAGCSSSSDPLTESSQLFSAISRIERQTPGGMNFTTEQAEELLKIINPVLMGTPYTEDMAKEMLDQTNAMLTDEQKALIDQSIDSIGDPSQIGQTGGMGGGTGVPGSGAGMGAGQGGTGVPGSRENIDPTGASGINMLLRLDDIITQNYLNN